MSQVCPACGVAVVSGYAKCPKCHAALPAKRLQTTASKAGGTVSEDNSLPITAIAVPMAVVIAFVVIAKLTCGGSSDQPEKQADQPVVQPQQPVAQPNQPQAPVDRPFGGQTAPTQPQGPDPNAAARDLERALRGKRLWSTIEIAGGRVDVRSAACDDPQMVPTISGMGPTLHDAGLTRVRCVAQSGTVVFERDL